MGRQRRRRAPSVAAEARGCGGQGHRASPSPGSPVARVSDEAGPAPANRRMAALRGPGADSRTAPRSRMTPAALDTAVALSGVEEVPEGFDELIADAMNNPAHFGHGDGGVARER